MGDLEMRQASAQLYAGTGAALTREKGSGDRRTPPMCSGMPLRLERTQPVASGQALAPSQDTPEEGWYIDPGEIWGSFG